MRKPFSLHFAVALVMGSSLPALAQSSPTTITPDRSQVLVNKDIAGQRWAIARNVNNGAVTGNVFSPGSNDPQFVYCDQTGETTSDYNYRCSGMGRCTVSDCATAWNFVAQVTLPKSFFAAGGPAPTPVPSSGLQGLLGTWQFNFTLATVNLSEVYRLNELVTLDSGLQAIRGLDSLGETVAVLRLPDALPTTEMPQEFYLEDRGTVICKRFFFDRAGDTVFGLYAQSNVVGGRCGAIQGMVPMSGTRISAATAASSDLSPSLALDREAMMQAGGASMGAESAPGMIEAANDVVQAIDSVR